MISPVFVLLSILPTLVSAANDWSVPCFQGVCAYDIKQDENDMPATMVISGSESAISDVTAAAGWEIVECDTATTAQDIRIVCTGDEQTTGCDHLYHEGAAGTIIRLPDSCGQGPFARVARAWTPEDQSLPDHVASRLVRRDGEVPVVHALTIDTEFDKTANMHGEVSMVVYGASGLVPPEDLEEEAIAEMNALRRRSLEQRGLGSIFKKIIKAIATNSFNETLTKPLPPISVVGEFPIVEASIDCSDAFKASLAVNVASDSSAQVKVGVVAAGKLLPFQIDQFAVITDLTADLKASLSVNAEVMGALDTGNMLLFEQGIPGFSIPGVLTVGPSFKLNARARAALDVDLDLSLDIAYKVDNARLFFPPQEEVESGGLASPSSSPLQLSFSPNVTTTASLEAHIIPSLDVGISALKIASANVFVELDASARLGLDFKAGAVIHIIEAPSETPSSNAVEFNGCVNLVGGIAANAGATASFFNLFNTGTKVPIFDEEFEFFKKCFGNGDSSAAASSLALDATSLEKRQLPTDLLCLVPNIGGAVNLIKELLNPNNTSADANLDAGEKPTRRSIII